MKELISGQEDTKVNLKLWFQIYLVILNVYNKKNMEIISPDYIFQNPDLFSLEYLKVISQFDIKGEKYEILKTIEPLTLIDILPDPEKVLDFASRESDIISMLNDEEKKLYNFLCGEKITDSSMARLADPNYKTDDIKKFIVKLGTNRQDLIVFNFNFEDKLWINNFRNMSSLAEQKRAINKDISVLNQILDELSTEIKSNYVKFLPKDFSTFIKDKYYTSKNSSDSNGDKMSQLVKLIELYKASILSDVANKPVVLVDIEQVFNCCTNSDEDFAAITEFISTIKTGEVSANLEQNQLYSYLISLLGDKDGKFNPSLIDLDQLILDLENIILSSSFLSRYWQEFLGDQDFDKLLTEAFQDLDILKNQTSNLKARGFVQINKEKISPIFNKYKVFEKFYHIIYSGKDQEVNLEKISWFTKVLEKIANEELVKYYMNFEQKSIAGLAEFVYTEEHKTPEQIASDNISSVMSSRILVSVNKDSTGTIEHEETSAIGLLYELGTTYIREVHPDDYVISELFDKNVKSIQAILHRRHEKEPTILRDMLLKYSILYLRRFHELKKDWYEKRAAEV